MNKGLKFKIVAQDVIPRNAGLCFTCSITNKLGNTVIFILEEMLAFPKQKMPLKSRQHTPDICLELYLPVCRPVVK